MGQPNLPSSLEQILNLGSLLKYVGEGPAVVPTERKVCELQHHQHPSRTRWVGRQNFCSLSGATRDGGRAKSKGSKDI